jgi:hypothetical protein
MAFSTRSTSRYHIQYTESIQELPLKSINANTNIKYSRLPWEIHNLIHWLGYQLILTLKQKSVLYMGIYCFSDMTLQLFLKKLINVTTFKKWHPDVASKARILVGIYCPTQTSFITCQLDTLSGYTSHLLLSA